MFVITTKDFKENIEASIMEHNKRLELLEAYAHECSSLHKKASEHWERQDATLKDLTTSNMRLANSLDSLNTTVVDIVKNDRPQTEFVKGWRITFSNNKLILVTIAAVIAFILSVVQLVRPFV